MNGQGDSGSGDKQPSGSGTGAGGRAQAQLAQPRQPFVIELYDKGPNGEKIVKIGIISATYSPMMGELKYYFRLRVPLAGETQQYEYQVVDVVPIRALVHQNSDYFMNVYLQLDDFEGQPLTGAVTITRDLYDYIATVSAHIRVRIHLGGHYKLSKGFQKVMDCSAQARRFRKYFK